MASRLSFAFALVLVAAISSAEALKCYECNSQDSTKCSYALTSFLYDTVECTNSLGGILSPQCYKIVGKTKEGKEFVARGCATAGGFACNALFKTVGAFSSLTSDPDSITDINCFTCDEDKCNSATKLTGITIVGVVLASILFLF